MNLISTNYSDHPDYGKPYGANIDSPGLRKSGEMKHTGDVATWDILKDVVNRDHPSLVMVNFGMTDSTGHSGAGPHTQTRSGTPTSSSTIYG